MIIYDVEANHNSSTLVNTFTEHHGGGWSVKDM